ncbi:hypothetical protein RF11_06945 [Thelohanellus kitauei]|uniref:Uncharacterized protein n=1 Tax=Thelohanellus kitauei TaxID=669202 RepID=A0A0C2MJX2_THEKT|nr:hypothetical protein RF11_06945 [Thelohanellus kitauei]
MNRYGIAFKQINMKPYKKESFLGYFENFLNHIQSNDLIGTPCVVIMDNVRFLKAYPITESFNKNGHAICFFIAPGNEEELFRPTEEGLTTLTGTDCDVFSYINYNCWEKCNHMFI